MRTAPEMKPCREEMRGESCYGLPSEKFGACGGTECGRLVTHYCPRCRVHRCRECARANPKGLLHPPLCPTCPETDPATYRVPEVYA